MATIDFVVKNGLVVTEEAQILSTVDSTSSTDNTAAIYTAGGAAIAKKLFVGTDFAAGGTLAVNGGSIITDDTTFNLLNSTATTINFGGAATAVEIGAATGTTSINNNLTVDGNATLGDASGDSVTFNASTANVPNALSFVLDNAENSAVSYPVSITHTSSSAPAQGIGTGIRFVTETANGNNEIGLTLESVSTDITNATEDFDFVVRAMINGAAAAQILNARNNRLQIGANATATTLTTQGASSLTINTNDGTNSGSIVINQGSNANIELTPNGTGDVYVNADTLRVGDSNADATVTTNGTGDLILNTNSGTNSGSIRLYDAANGNIEVTTNGTGYVNVATGGGTQLRITNTASAVNYVQVTGAATTNFPVISVQGNDANPSLGLTAKGTGSLIFFTNNSAQRQFRITHTASSVNYLNVTGAATGNNPEFSVVGDDTNIGINVTTKGTGAVRINTGGGEQARIINVASANRYVEISGSQAGVNAPGVGTGGGAEAFDIFSNANAIRFWSGGKQSNQIFNIAHTASSVNYLQVAGSATGTGPIFSAQGSDTNIDILYSTKGTSGQHVFRTNSTVRQFQVNHVTSAVNYATVNGATTTNGPAFGVAGTDTNIDLRLVPKGTGSVVIPATLSLQPSSPATTNALVVRSNTRYVSPDGNNAITAYMVDGGTLSWEGTSGQLFSITDSLTGTIFAVNDISGIPSLEILDSGLVKIAETVGNVLIGTATDNILDRLQVNGNASITGSLRLTGNIIDLNRNSILDLNATTSAVNRIAITNNSTGNNPVIAAAGTDTNIGLNVASKGTGNLSFTTGGGLQFRIANKASADIYLQATGGQDGVSRTSFGQEGTGSAGFNIYARGGNAIRFQTNGVQTNEQLIISHTSASVNYFDLTGSSAGNRPRITVDGNDTNIGIRLSTKGTGDFIFQTGGGSEVTQLAITHTASAVNYVQITGSATGVAPIVSAQGSDTNIPLRLASKGTQTLVFATNYSGTGTGNQQFSVSHTANSVNFLNTTGSTAGNSPILSSAGVDTNIDITLSPKGTGRVLIPAGLTLTPSSPATVPALRVQSIAEYISPDGNNTIANSMLNGGTLSWDGTAGQLFSITDSLTGTIFTVNDISGIPIIAVEDTGQIRLAEIAGNVLIGTSTDNGIDKLQVNGGITTTGQITITRGNNTASGSGQIYLNGATGNRIDFNTNGVAAPAFTTRSAGTKLVLFPGVSASAVDYAIGMESSNLWFSTTQTSTGFRWYGGTTLAASLSGAGLLTLTDDLAVNGGDITTTQTTFNLVNATATTVSFAGAATTLAIANTATAAQTVNLGTASTGASTYNIATGATAAATTKTLNIGTGGAASSTTNINIGSSNGGTTTINSVTVTTTGQIISTRANNTGTGSGQIYLNGATGNRIDFNTNGVAAPAFTTRSAGTKIVLYPNIGASSADFALGIDNNTLWSSVATSSQFFRWYGGTTLAATLTGAGLLTLTDDLAVNGGDITTTQTTFNLINATATTLNFAGAATAITMGATTGETNIRNRLFVNNSTLALRVRSNSEFVSPDGTKTMNMRMLDSDTLSWSGTAGQLFSITNSLTGTIFAVNDISGIPSIEVLSSGLVKLAEYNGNVVIGSATDNGVDKLQVTGSLSTTGNVTVGGNLVVNGTTTTVNSTVTTIDDPVITLGGDTAPTVDDNKDRGIEFRWHNGTSAKVGFFGFDDSTGQFTFIPDATNTSEVFSGTKGTIDAFIAYSNVTGAPAAAGDGTLTLAVSGTGLSGSASFTANQSTNTTFTVTSNATADNTANAIVARDASGNFTAGTATLGGLRIDANGSTGNGGLRLWDNSSSNAAPWLESVGLRSDNNNTAAFAGGVALASVKSAGLPITDKVLGRALFGGNITANDFTSLRYSGSIVGYATGDWTTTSTPTGFRIYVGSTPRTPETANVTFGETLAVQIDSSANMRVNGNLELGGSNTSNFIAFRGTTGDGPGSYNHTYVGERIYSGTERAELLLFKGNDADASSGPDRIRHFANEHQFDTFTTATSGTFETVATSANALTRMVIKGNGNVLIGTTTDGGFKLQVNGSFAATTKSFVIDHPTKPGKKLRYGSLEGPENGVYVRGRLKDSSTIELPEYWTELVDADSITVNLTAVGSKQTLYVKEIRDNCVHIAGSRNIDCFYTVFGERKDVDKLEVEINGD